MTALDLTSRVVDSHVVVVAGGVVDRGTAPRFRQFLLAALASGEGGLVIDLNGLDLIDSSGLGALLFAFERAERVDRPLVIVHDDELLRSVFRVSGFSTLYEFHSTVDAALDAL